MQAGYETNPPAMGMSGLGSSQATASATYAVPQSTTMPLLGFCASGQRRGEIPIGQQPGDKEAPVDYYDEEGLPSPSMSMGTLFAAMDGVVKITPAGLKATEELGATDQSAKVADIPEPPASSNGTSELLAATPPGVEEDSLPAGVPLAEAVNHPADGREDTAAGSPGPSAKSTDS